MHNQFYLKQDNLKGTHKLFETLFEMFLFKEKSNLLRVCEKNFKSVLKLQNFIFKNF